MASFIDLGAIQEGGIDLGAIQSDDAPATLTANHIWLPLNGVPTDAGDRAYTFAQIGTEGDAWSRKTGWFSGSGTNGVWSEDTGVVSLIDFLNGALAGVGGLVLHMHMDIQNNLSGTTSGTLFDFGSSNAASKGFKLLTNTANTQVIYSANDVGSLGNNALTSAWLDNDDLEHSFDALLDMKNGTYIMVLDGRILNSNGTNLPSYWADSDDIDLAAQAIGLTLMGRNNSTSTGTHTPASGYQGSMRRFFLADISAIRDPQTYFYKIHREFNELAAAGDFTTLPATIVSKY